MSAWLLHECRGISNLNKQKTKINISWRPYNSIRALLPVTSICSANDSGVSGRGRWSGHKHERGRIGIGLCRCTRTVTSSRTGHIYTAASNLTWHLSRTPRTSNESISMSISSVLCQKWDLNRLWLLAQSIAIIRLTSILRLQCNMRLQHHTYISLPVNIHATWHE
jgi:hypothetical protein